MRRFFAILVMAGVLFLPSCKRVSLQYQGDDPYQITVPMFAIFQAMRFTDDDVLEIEDLAGIDEEIPLKALAEAIRQGGDDIKVSFKQGDTRILGEKRGRVFHIQLDDPEEETHVMLRLPEGLLMALLESRDGKVDEKQVKRALKRFTGTLMEVRSPDEQLRIVFR